MDTPGSHSIEHIVATFLRHHEAWEEDIIGVLREAADYVLNYDDNTPIPGYSPRDCGNYLDNNLKLAKIYMKKFKEEVLDNPVEERLSYPV